MAEISSLLNCRTGNSVPRVRIPPSPQQLIKIVFKQPYKYKSMFDFEKLEVYQVTKLQNIDLLKWLVEHKDLDKDIAEPWKAGSLGTVLNLAESTARMTHPDKKHYLTIARGNINTCVALLEVAKEFGWIDYDDAERFYAKYEQMSKMMLGMIRSFSEDKKL